MGSKQPPEQQENIVSRILRALHIKPRASFVKWHEDQAARLDKAEGEIAKIKKTLREEMSTVDISIEVNTRRKL